MSAMTRSARTSRSNMSRRMFPERAISPVVPPCTRAAAIAGWMSSRSTRSKSMPFFVAKGRTMKTRTPSSALHEASEVSEVDVARDGLADLHEIVHSRDGIELRDDVRIDPGEPEAGEPGAGQVGIVARVQECAAEVVLEWHGISAGVTRHQVAEFAVDHRTDRAAPDGPAVHVLVDLRLVHDRAERVQRGGEDVRLRVVGGR